MYNFRTFSFVLFTGMFWGVELAVAAAVWIYLAMFTTKDAPAEEESTEIKTEGDLGSTVKQEAEPAVQDHASAAEADDEDEAGEEDATAVGAHGRLDSDSGVGTSAEGASAASVRRRPLVKQEEE